MRCPKCGHQPIRRPAVAVQPADNFHVHGKALSGHRHAHALAEGEDPLDPDHEHADHPDGPWSYT